MKPGFRPDFRSRVGETREGRCFQGPFRVLLWRSTLCGAGDAVLAKEKHERSPDATQFLSKASQELHQCDVLLPGLWGNSSADLASCERFGLHL